MMWSLRLGEKFDEGREEGRAEGREEGREEERASLAAIADRLSELGRSEELVHVIKDAEYERRVRMELGLA